MSHFLADYLKSEAFERYQNVFAQIITIALVFRSCIFVRLAYTNINRATHGGLWIFHTVGAGEYPSCCKMCWTPFSFIKLRWADAGSHS